MIKSLVACLICAAIVVGCLAIYLLTGEDVLKTALMIPPMLAMGCLLYEESLTVEVETVEVWTPLTVE